MLLILSRLARSLRRRRRPAHAAVTTSERARRAPAAGRAWLDLVLHQAHYDLIALFRNRQARFSTLILPPVLLVILASAFGDDGPGQAAAARVPGIAALGVLVARFVNPVVSITTQRESGVLKRRRATPVPAAVLIAARTLTAVVAALAATSAVYTLGHVVYGVRVPATAVPALAVITLAASTALAAVAYALSTAIRSIDAAQPLVQAIALPLYLISGVFVPAGDLPGWLQDLGACFPLERLVDGLHHAVVHGAIAWGAFAVLVAWAVAGVAIALRRFTWMPATASAF